MIQNDVQRITEEVKQMRKVDRKVQQDIQETYTRHFGNWCIFMPMDYDPCRRYSSLN